MKSLTDRGILWRTFPVMPRRRLKYDPDIPAEFTLFGGNDPVFKCLGGFFSYNTYNFLDWVVSYWNEMSARYWIQRFRQDRPGALNKQLENLPQIAPVLGYGKDDLLKLKNNLPELQQHFRNYVILPSISDLEMRKHPALERLSCRDLLEVIERSAKARIKTIYPVRVLDGTKKDPKFTYFYEMNLKDSDPWSHLFEYRLLEERKSKTGKVIERFYKFGFTGLISALMIHNTVCGASWNMNPVFYGLSSDAQLLYRYLVVAGSRNKVNRVDYIGHRLGWREKQKKRLAGRVERILKEIQGGGLIENAAVNSGRKGIYLCSFNIPGKRG